MYGDQFGEFVCGYWGLKGYLFIYFFQVMMPWIKLLSQARQMKTFKDILKLLGGLFPLQETS